MTRVLLLAVTLAACADEVADVPPLGDYMTWERRATWGETAGHGNTYRIIFANDVATTYTGGDYPEGTTLVKEVYELDGPAQKGALRLIEIMRRSGPVTDDREGGWIFTAATTPGGEELLKENFCWRRCHRAAPFGGTFFDYSVDPITP